MKTFLIFLALAIVAAATATYARYQSFSPCDWMEQDFANDSGLPRVVVRGRINAEFYIRGITEPGPKDCIMAWWDFRLERLPKHGQHKS